MKNLELKARYEDLHRAEKIAQDLGAKFQWEAVQRDTFFRVPNGRLKLREVAGKTAELIGYVRPDEKQAKWSDYEILPVETPEKLKSILSRSLGVLAVVQKKRKLFLLKNARIHLDEVQELGHFLEFEVVISNSAQEKSASDFMEFLKEKFRVREGQLISRAYVDLLVEKESKEAD